MGIVKVYLSLAASLTLVGCASSPGFYMDESRLREKAIQGPQSAQQEQVFDVVPITAALVKEQNTKFQQESEPKGNDQLELALKNYTYRVGQEDILSIIVWDHPELTTPAGQYRSPEESGFLVNKNGSIFFPYAGVMKVAGKTTEEIREQLTARLTKFIVRPQLSVRVASYRSQRVNVTGEVKKAGVLPITDVPMTAIDAINLSEGNSTEADLGNVMLTRHGVTRRLNLQALNDSGDLSQNLLLQDGDLLYIPDNNRNKIFVLGEVRKSSSFLMPKGRMSLAEAIGSSEGFDQLASDPSRIYVIRGDLMKPSIYRLNGGNPDAMLLASQFQLKPRDVIYVSTSEITRWNRIISQILPSILPSVQTVAPLVR